jgi:transposase InsO family protein
MTFIDDFSRKTWVYLLKQKSQDFDIFKRFKFMIEKESGKYIKVLISDRGGEYMLTDFMEFCQSHRIKRHFTTRYTPQQNRVVERKNQTIMNMDRSMLKEKHLPNEYWGDAVVCSVNILNRVQLRVQRTNFPRKIRVVIIGAYPI